MPKQINAFQCSFCRKHYLSKSSALVHEKKCYFNPKNKTCQTCEFLYKDSETIYVRPHGDQNYGDADYEMEYLMCAKQECEIDRYKMPKNCEFHKTKGMEYETKHP